MDLGLRFIVEPSGTRLTEDEKRALADLRPAGIMLRKRNFLQAEPYDVWLDEYAKLLHEIRDAVQRPHLLITIDHEGGQVHRFPPPVTRFPYPALYGSSLEAVDIVAAAMGRELCALGINVSFSPVADIHSNPANPVINQRAFGRTADEVRERAVVFARGLRREGLIACAKHFPGHGDTAVDSHLTLPVIDRGIDELRARELVPFRALIEDGVEMVMSAHIVLPQVDPHAQATLSRTVMSDLLRDELGFTGVSIADALGMKAIVDDVQTQSFCARAHNAGVDLLLFVGDPVTIADACAARNEFARSVEAAEVEPRSLEISEARIFNLLMKSPQYPVVSIPSEVLEQHAELVLQLSSGAEWQQFDFDPKGFA